MHRGSPLEFELSAANLKFLRDVGKQTPPDAPLQATRNSQKNGPMYAEYPHVFEATWNQGCAYCWFTDIDGKRRRLTKHIPVTADTDLLGTSDQIRRGVAAFLETAYSRKVVRANGDADDDDDANANDHGEDEEGGIEEAENDEAETSELDSQEGIEDE